MGSNEKMNKVNFPLRKEEERWVEECWQKLDAKLIKAAVRSRGKIPFWSESAMHNDVKETSIVGWTNGFWPGMMWLMYIGTGREEYAVTAKIGEELLDKALEQVERFGHDTGFVWMLASRPNYELTQNQASLRRLRLAAAYLMDRYNPVAQYIRCWNSFEPGKNDKMGWSIIDTMMNLPLLYWASENTQDPRHRFVAMSHADMAMREHVRPDGSVYHIVIRDAYTGEILEKRGLQGYGKESSWSRGQSWALYGFTLSYLYTGKQEYLDTAKRVAHYFIASVCEDWLPKSDFRAPEEPVYYDSSAGMCAACGLLELAKIVPEYEKRLYLHGAMKILMNVEKNFADWSEETDFIIGKSSGWYSKEQNVNMIYADYFFTEALFKLKGFEPRFW